MNDYRFIFKGIDNLDIHAHKWEAENCKAVIQIAHGMAETSSRYERFACELNKHGFTVYANDHRGHGLTANGIENLGYLADEDGFKHLVDDLNILTNIIKVENPDKPVFLLGHSMGSFASQRYFMEYHENIDGLLLSGSNGKHGPILNLSKFIINKEIKKKGRFYRSDKINNLIFGTYNNKFKPARTEFDWLTRDSKEVDLYIENPYCGKLSTLGFFHDFMTGLTELERKENIRKIPTNKPIYIFSGTKDPVGRYGKGVEKLEKQYRKLGVKSLECKLYEDGRHEMLNEINRDEVTKDIIDWLLKQLDNANHVSENPVKQGDKYEVL